MATAEYGRSLRVGVASIDITPAVGVSMQGYELRHATGITDPLIATALVVSSDSLKWLLLTVDLIGLDRRFTSRVRKTLANSLSLRSSAITIACSHTHSGPATLSRLGIVPCEDSYLTFLYKKLTGVAETAANSLQAARWRFGSEQFPQNINRRIKTLAGVKLGTDPKGPVDSRLRVIRIDRAGEVAGSSPLALIVHYACHATCSGGVPSISADWPGAMRVALQSTYGSEDPPIVCFVQGCTGDVTHRIARDRDSWPEHFGQHTAVQSEILGRLAAATAFDASEQSVEFPAEALDVITEPLLLPFHDHFGSEETEMQLLRIGPLATCANSSQHSVWFVGLPAEPFTAYSTGLGDCFQRQLSAEGDNVLVCGYINDLVGYLCTPEALRDGGYEASVAHHFYHRPSPFSVATQSLVFDRILGAAGRIGVSKQVPVSWYHAWLNGFGHRRSTIA
jgi:neutral ceramidase